MSSFNARIAIRLMVVTLLAALTAGCFQPMYGEYNAGGGPGLRDKLSAVDVSQISATLPRDARLTVELRNGLIFGFTGGGSAAAPTHRLVVRMNTQRASIIVDITTSRPDMENYGIDASYQLIEIATDKVVLNASTFARVSYDIPGQQQRFARIRGLRDAENRAIKVIADNITQRLSSYFVAGT